MLGIAAPLKNAAIAPIIMSNLSDLLEYLKRSKKGTEVLSSSTLLSLVS